MRGGLKGFCPRAEMLRPAGARRCGHGWALVRRDGAPQNRAGRRRSCAGPQPVQSAGHALRGGRSPAAEGHPRTGRPRRGARGERRRSRARQLAWRILVPGGCAAPAARGSTATAAHAGAALPLSGAER